MPLFTSDPMPSAGSTDDAPAPTGHVAEVAPAPMAAGALVRREYGPAGHYLLTGRALRRLRDAQQLVEKRLRAAAVRRTHLPVLVPPVLVAPVEALLAPGLRRTAVTTHDSERPKGWYPTAGLCLRGLPLVAKQRFSWRELPVGYWTSGPAVAPVATAGPDAEDQVCADGLLAQPQERPTDPAAVIGELLDALGVPTEPAAEPWALTGDALVWRHKGRVTASVQDLPADAAKRYGACYMDTDNRLQPLAVSFFHISQYALLRGTEDLR
ncbi:hypothetical protein AB0N17_14995 [Streptomyces sp. NPDC051133]|uniref:hypothetical protein n=1 Tax=Streptomyces sp. NPDC051133 TaxID=3155521 RepID=UPI00341E95A5